MALLGQTLLPVAHALELERADRGAPPAASAAAVSEPGAASLTAASRYEARHDPATCAACRSLVQSSHAVAQHAGLYALAAARSPSPLTAADARSEDSERAHPPRAPPSARAPRHPGA